MRIVFADDRFAELKLLIYTISDIRFVLTQLLKIKIK